MLIGRQSGLSGAEREAAAGWGWRRPVHLAVWGLLGLVGVLVLLMGALIILGEEPAVRSAPSAASEAAGTTADLQGVRTQVESEAAMLAALRDQADQARAELADLQQQQAAARATLADLERQQAAARAALDEVTQGTPAHDSAVPTQPPATPALDRAPSRLRRQAAREEQKPQPHPEAVHTKVPRILSPPPTVLGQIPASAVDDDTPTAPAGPRVFLQYRPGSSGQQQATDLTRRLLESDFANAQMRAVPVSTQIPLIRYFHPEDAGAAQNLADLLRGDGVDFRVEYTPGASARGSDGLIEVWIP
jgi:hypothetical protein